MTLRVLTSSFRTQTEASSATDIGVVFATITHAELVDPIHVNSDVVAYALDGNTYLGAAFNIQLLSDDDKPPRGRVSIANVDADVGKAIRRLKTRANLRIEIYARSDFDDQIPRQPIGSPQAQYSADGLTLRNVTGNFIQIEGDLSTLDIATEPWPSVRSTPDRLPGLYARAPIAG